MSFTIELTFAQNHLPTMHIYQAIPTMHRSDFSILERNDKTEEERLRLFLRLSQFAIMLKALLTSVDPGSFLDFPDIDGGAAVGQSSVTIYDEVSSTRSCLGYRVFLYMGVQIVDHPKWGFSNLAVHTILIYARPKDAQNVLLKMASCFEGIRSNVKDASSDTEDPALVEGEAVGTAAAAGP
jgi:hypothetical protein